MQTVSEQYQYMFWCVLVQKFAGNFCDFWYFWQKTAVKFGPFAVKWFWSYLCCAHK